MTRLQSVVAVLCVLLLLAPGAGAQAPLITHQNNGRLGGILQPYRFEPLPPVDFANSGRLESLLRAGSIYLSLQDAIALALENNLDIQMQRYTPITAQANLLRAEAGGLLRGVPSNVQTSTTSALNLITGGTSGGGGGGGVRGGTGDTGGVAGGAIITQTGTAVPNLDPFLFLAGQVGHFTSPQTNTFVTGTNSLVRNQKALNWGIQKGFLSGTILNFGVNSTNAWSNSFRNDPNPFTSSAMSLSVSQHLLQGFGLAVNNRNIRISKNNQRVADLTFQLQVIQTVASVISAYWDLVSFNENVKARKQALDLAQKLYEDNKKQVEIGTLAPISIVQAEAEVATAQQALVNAQTQLAQQETLLKNALSKTGVASPSIADARIIPMDRISVPEQEPIAPVQDLVAEAMSNRPELKQSQINIESQRISLVGTKQELWPSLDVQGTLTNNALAGQLSDVPFPNIPNAAPGLFTRTPADPYFIGGYGSVLGQLFRRNFPDYSLSFQLNIPLRNRSAKVDMIIDQVNLRQQEISQQRLINGIRVDVRNAQIALQNARAGYQAAVKARVLQEQNLEAEQKKYALGASTIYFVIQYQRDLATARVQEVAAESAYAKAKVQMDLALGQTLPRNNISIDEALKGRVSRPPSALPAVQQP